jgi:hypothetical protein
MQQQKVNIEALTARRRKVWVTLAKKEIGKVLFDWYNLFPFLTKILDIGTKSTQQLPQRSTHQLQKIGSTLYASRAEQSYSGIKINMKVKTPTAADLYLSTVSAEYERYCLEDEAANQRNASVLEENRQSRKRNTETYGERG